MRTRKSLSLLLSIGISASALMSGFAKADSVSTEVLTEYILQDYAIVTCNKPVDQSEGLINSGRSTFGGWISTGFGTKDVWGHRGGCEEFDGEYWFDDHTNTIFGPLNYEFSVDYYDLGHAGPHSGLGSTGDDIVQVYGEGARPFTAGKFTISPYVRLTGYVGVGYLPSTVQTRTGIRLNYTSGLWSFDADGGYVHHWLSFPGDTVNVLRTNVGITYGKQIAVTLEERSSNSDVEGGLKLTYHY